MNIVQKWVWGLLGYKCCLPVHKHELKGVMDEYYERVNKTMTENRAQMLEFLKQQGEANDGILSVRIVK